MADTADQRLHLSSYDIVVLGVGNLLLGDEGAGVHALKAFEAVCPDKVLAIDAGTAIARTEWLLQRARLIIAFDAMETGGEPGSMYVVDARQLACAGVRDSLHEYGLPEALQSLESEPPVLVLGVEPENIAVRCELSAAVAGAIPKMVDAALAAIDFWRKRPQSLAGSGAILELLTEQLPLQRLASKQAEPEAHGSASRSQS